MKAALKRRVDEAHLSVHDEWLGAWAEWGRAAVRLCREVEPQAGERLLPLYGLLYQEWVAAYLAGELPAFLSRGASLAKWWASAPDLWTWLWEAQVALLDGDLRAWPNQLPQPPDVPEGALERVVAGMTTAEDCALALAICSAQGRGGV